MKMKTDVFAEDIMIADFDTINQDAPIEDAIKTIFAGKVRGTGDKATSIMVVDGAENFVGIITMFDILYHIRPGFLNFGLEGNDISWLGMIDICKKELMKKKVRDLMSSEVVGALKGEHMMTLLDRMVKNKYHRLPVLENNKLIGVVYISDIYFHLFARAGLVNQYKA